MEQDGFGRNFSVVAYIISYRRFVEAYRAHRHPLMMTSIHWLQEGIRLGGASESLSGLEKGVFMEVLRESDTATVPSFPQ